MYFALYICTLSTAPSRGNKQVCIPRSYIFIYVLIMRCCVSVVGLLPPSLSGGSSSEQLDDFTAGAHGARGAVAVGDAGTRLGAHQVSQADHAGR